MADDLISAALDSMPFSVTSVDVDGVILFVNATAARNISLSRDEAIGKSLYDLFPDRAVATRERLRQAVAAREVQHFETVLTLPNGEERFFDSSYCPSFDEAGNARAVQIVALDLTHMHRPQQPSEVWELVSDDLSMTPVRVQAVLENAPLIVSIYDLDMRTRYINRVLPGRSIADAIGHTPDPFLTESARPVFHDAFRRAVEKQLPTECEVQGQSGRFWLVRFAPLVHDGQTRQVLACTIDVTEQRRLQTRLAQKQKVESLGTMAGGIAHDFNNLLAVIMGHTGVIRRRLARGGEVETLLDEVDIAAQRAADLCVQMLVYAGRDQRTSESSDLNTVIREMTPLTRAAVDGRMHVDYSLTPEKTLTGCGRAQLGQIVLNLVNNAADAIGAEEGRVTIATECVEVSEPRTAFLPESPAPGRYVQLTVSDTGLGLAAEQIDLIFDPFFSTKSTGHGLGLSVVMGILSSCHGAIRVESSRGEGTTMTVLVPFSDVPHDVLPSSDALHRWREGRGTVLVVDDEALVRTMVSRVLDEAGYRVETASDGATAIAMFRERRDSFDAIVLDVTMPDLDGHATLERVRAIRSDIPVLLSSGRPVDVPDGDPYLRFIAKPYSSAALTRALAEALSPKRADRSSSAAPR